MTIQMKQPIVKMPDHVQLSIYLIKEELKSRRLFHALHEVGLDDCYFQPHLDVLILESIGLSDRTDETLSMYEAIMDRRSKKIEADNDSVMKQALKAYHELLNEKEKLRQTKKERY